MLDFQEAGELGVFIDEEQLRALEEKMEKRGYLEGSEMATTFNMLRANDLIWSFVVNNYLMGNEPFPFDLLYWNSDSTRMPAAMHSFYLRNMYQENLLCRPGGVDAERPADRPAPDQDAGLLPVDAGRPHRALEEHLSRHPAAAAARTASCSRPAATSPGVVNPPEGGKYSHWINRGLPPDPETWLASASEMAGSWWPDWQRWILAHDKEQVPARVPGAGGLQAIEPAPGSYVRVKGC